MATPRDERATLSGLPLVGIKFGEAVIIDSEMVSQLVDDRCPDLSARIGSGAAHCQNGTAEDGNLVGRNEPVVGPSQRSRYPLVQTGQRLTRTCSHAGQLRPGRPILNYDLYVFQK